MNNSSLKDYNKLISENRIPNDFYDEPVFIYKIFDSADTRILTIKNLYGQMEKNANLLFHIEFLGEIKGKWGDSNRREITSRKVNSKIRTSLEIKNSSSLNLKDLNLNSLYLFSPFRLENYLDEENNFLEPIGKFPFIPSGTVNVGINQTIFLNLDAFGSYQFSFAKNENGFEVDNVITLAFTITQGVNVSKVLIERNGYCEASQEALIFLDEAGNNIAYDIDFDASSQLIFGDVDFIELNISNTNNVTIYSHTYSGLRIIDAYIDNADGYIGTPFFENINVVPGGTQPEVNEYVLNPNNTNQLRDEMIGGSHYYRYLYNEKGAGQTDLDDFWRGDPHLELVPNNKLIPVAMLKSITAENNPNYQNINKDEEYWFTADWKQATLFFLFAGDQTYGIDIASARSIKNVNYGSPERAQQIINGFWNGELTTYKGMTIKPLPDMLITASKSDYKDLNYSNEEDIDFHIVTTYDLINSYKARKPYLDLNNPISFTQKKAYKLDIYDRTKNQPNSSAFQKQTKNSNILFFNQNETIKQVIIFREKGKIVQQIINRVIGGGEKMIITLLDESDNLALNAAGETTNPITIQNNWFFNQNKTLTKTEIAFVSSIRERIFKLGKYKNVTKNSNINLIKSSLEEVLTIEQLDQFILDFNKDIISNPNKIQQELYFFVKKDGKWFNKYD